MATDRESQSPGALAFELDRQMFELIGGYRTSQSIYVVAKLDIAGLLRDGPKTCDELAEVTSTNAAALYRVLRYLSGCGLFAEIAPRQFALTELGARLQRDVPGSIRPNVLMLLNPDAWGCWADMEFSVRSGETAFEHVYGMGLFDYLEQHPDEAEVFNQAMTVGAVRSGAAITQAYDFSPIHHLVDVGGGHGLLMATVLRAHEAMRGTVFDRPEVVAGASTILREAAVVDRCHIVGGDFSVEVPEGADGYILRQIIHDWDDERALRILQNCRRTMSGNGRLLVVERRVDSDYRRALPALSIDLEMLVKLGGSERSDEEYARLFAAAGFRLTGVTPLHDMAEFAVFEGEPA